MFSTPVLFLVFNREDTAQKVFDAIKKQKPAKFYIAADGPRENKEGEKERCQKVREIINQIDWDCEVKTLFREENLGCRRAVSSAISWFFEQEEMGIILEDDCLPNTSFFFFCEEMLHKYKEDERIGHISGNSYFPELISANQSYDFTTLPHIWGWATWKRVWKNYDVDFPYWTSKNNSSMRKRLFINKREEIYFSSFLSDTLSKKHGINAWSPQYVFSLRLQNQLSIYPKVNMVTNIGLEDQEATHTSKKTNRTKALPQEEIKFPLEHPSYILRNKELDNKTTRKTFFSWKRLIRYILNNY